MALGFGFLVRCLEQWLGRPLTPQDTRDALVARLSREISQCDQRLTDQLNEILHDPRFQRLEASWRGLRYLTERAYRETYDRDPTQPRILIKVLNATKDEIRRDVGDEHESTSDVTRTCLFRFVHDGEFGMAGGEPFAAIIGDFEFDSGDVRDVRLLTRLAKIAAMSFAPLIAAASPRLLGLPSFRELERMEYRGREMITRTDQVGFEWSKLRKDDDARFVVLTLPRVLLRTPYEPDGTRRDGFRFQEDASDQDGHGWLWGNAAFALGGVLIRAFSQANWLADICGARADSGDDLLDAGGAVVDLPASYLPTEAFGVAPRFPVEVRITDQCEGRLVQQGLMPIMPWFKRGFNTGQAAFHSAPTLNLPHDSRDDESSTDERLAAQLPNVFALCRFAHGAKAIARHKIGSEVNADSLRRKLHQWLMNYVDGAEDSAPEVRAKRPLYAAEVKVKHSECNPGAFDCILELMPHPRCEELMACMQL